MTSGYPLAICAGLSYVNQKKRGAKKNSDITRMTMAIIGTLFISLPLVHGTTPPQ